MLAGIIFDLDGVIADTHTIHRHAWRQLLGELGRQFSDEELDFVLEGCKREEILRHFLGSLSAAEVSRYGERKDELFRQSSEQLQSIPGVVDFLRQLDDAGVPKAVATCASKRRTFQVLESLGLAGRFGAVVTGDDVPKGKPDPSIFHLAAGCLRVTPQQSLVIEDSGAGVRAAKSADMKCLAIASGTQADKLRQEGADYVVPNFTGILLVELQSLFHPQPTNGQ
jgi:beta-phosphoglucomutase